jgi:hypothetical protein
MCAKQEKEKGLFCINPHHFKVADLLLHTDKVKIVKGRDCLATSVPVPAVFEVKRRDCS